MSLIYHGLGCVYKVLLPVSILLSVFVLVALPSNSHCVLVLPFSFKYIYLHIDNGRQGIRICFSTIAMSLYVVLCTAMSS